MWSGPMPISMPSFIFGRPFVKRFALYAIGQLSCLSVCLSVTLVYCGQTARCIKVSFPAEVSLGPGDNVLDGDPARHQKRDKAATHFSARVLWQNGWTDPDATWCGGRPRPRRHCVRWKPSSPKGAHPLFSAHVCCAQTAGSVSYTHLTLPTIYSV